MKRHLRSLPALTGMFLLSACVSFGGKPPATLLTLTADTGGAAVAPRNSADASTLMVLVPTVPQSLANDHVAVRTSDNSLAYLKDARWSDQPAHLFADLLSETISARTGRLVVDRRQYALAPGQRLTGRVQQFELDAVKREVVIVYDAALAPGDGKPLLARRFEARVATASEKPVPVAQALNQAANEIAGQVVEWLGPAATP